MSDIPKGYKQTEVGVIPEEWEVCSVARKGEIVTGKALAVNGAGCKRPYLRTKNVFDGRVDIEDVLMMPMTDEQFSQFRVRQGDVLLNEGQSLELVGRCAIYNEEYPEPCAIQNQLIRFRARAGVSGVFASHLFRHCQQTGVFAGIALQTTSIAHLGGSRFGRLLLCWPTSEDEQRAIAEALSDADTLIESLDRLIAKKRDLKKAAMQQLLTGKRRLPGFSGTWDVKRIKDIGLPQSERNEGGTSLPVLTCSKHLGFVDSLGFFKNQVFSKDLGSYKVIRYGQIGYPANHIEEGSIGLQDLYEVALVSPIYVIFAVNDNVNSCFLHRLLKLDSYRLKFKTATTSSVDRRGSLRWPGFSEITVLLPPTLSEQTAIAEVLTDMEAEIASLEQHRNKTRALKQGMMQALLTGRIRLVNTSSASLAVASQSKGEDGSQSKHNWQINEAVIIAVLVKMFGSEKFPLARKRCTKLTYLLHRHVEGKADGYLKKAAGPYNPATKYKGPELIAQKNGYVKTHNNGTYPGFVVAENIQQAETYFQQWYGNDSLSWLAQFKYKKTDELELLATVDMAMQDLSKAGILVNLNSVKQVIRDHPEWVAKLAREVFSDSRIDSAICACKLLFARTPSAS